MLTLASPLIVPFGGLNRPRHQDRNTNSGVAPFVCIHPTQGVAITLEHFPSIFSAPDLLRENDLTESLFDICETLRAQVQRSHEHLFLMLYFDQIAEMLKIQRRSALLPLPKTHLTEPRGDNAGEPGQKCIRADFAFWTGNRLAAVMIDETQPQHDCLSEDRLLRRWGVTVFRLMTAKKSKREGIPDFCLS